MSVPPASAWRAYRYVFMAVLGLVIGIIATVMAGRAIRARQDPFPDSLMQVMGYQLRALRHDGASSCAAVQMQTRQQTLRLLAGDLEAAFPSLADDSRYREHAAALRLALDRGLHWPLADCAAQTQQRHRIEDACEACHRDFR